MYINCDNRRRMKTEEKAKVVAAVWGTEMIQFLAVLAILPVLRSRNYLFSAPAPFRLQLCPLFRLRLRLQLLLYISDYYFKLYYNSSSIRNKSQWRFFFIQVSSKLVPVIYIKNIISASAPAPGLK